MVEGASTFVSHTINHQPSTINPPVSEPIAILNGHAVPVSQAAISVFDTGFVHGAAVGDMIRTFRQRPFRLADHLERFQRGVAALRISGAPKLGEWEAAVEELLDHNAGLIPPESDLGIIVFATAGWNPTYLSPDVDCPTCTWGAHTFPLPFVRLAADMQNGRHLVIPPCRQIPAQCLDGRIKWRNRVHWFLADKEARAANPKASALLVDFDGHMTETSSANFFVVRDGTILTPRPDNTLDGVSRRVVFELARELNLPCEFAELRPADAYTADEAFLSSTPCCLMPVANIDGYHIGDDVPGPVYSRLMTAWNELVGVNIIEQIVKHGSHS